MQAIDSIFYVVILIMSVIVHEVAHGYTAYILGDKTAEYEGRLTLNPIPHIDIFGSIILPLFLVLSNSGFVIGWAKPVPYNPNNLKDQKWGTFLVAISGIVANLILAVIFGLFIRFGPELGFSLYDLEFNTLSPVFKISTIIVMVNLVLAFFNLIPIPPLDGSKVLFSLLSYRYRNIEAWAQKWGIFLLLLFIIFIWSKFAPVIYIIFSLITGL